MYEREAELDAIAEMLIQKNQAYGNSALSPIRLFSSASPEEQIRVRLDDKLSRLAKGKAAGEDTLIDLIGYLFLLRIVTKPPMDFRQAVAEVVAEVSERRVTVSLRSGSRTEREFADAVIELCGSHARDPVYLIDALLLLRRLWAVARG